MPLVQTTPRRILLRSDSTELTLVKPAQPEEKNHWTRWRVGRSPKPADWLGQSVIFEWKSNTELSVYLYRQTLMNDEVKKRERTSLLCVVPGHCYLRFVKLVSLQSPDIDAVLKGWIKTSFLFSRLSVARQIDEAFIAYETIWKPHVTEVEKKREGGRGPKRIEFSLVLMSICFCGDFKT